MLISKNFSIKTKNHRIYDNVFLMIVNSIYKVSPSDYF